MSVTQDWCGLSKRSHHAFVKQHVCFQLQQTLYTFLQRNFLRYDAKADRLYFLISKKIVRMLTTCLAKGGGRPRHTALMRSCRHKSHVNCVPPNSGSMHNTHAPESECSTAVAV